MPPMSRAPLLPAAILLMLACAGGGREAGLASNPVPSAPSHGFSAGAASRVITPSLGDASRIVYVGGLERGQKATGIHDDLYARALVMSDSSGASIGLVVLDLIGFFHDDVETLRDELKARHPDVKLDYLAVASTHTHAGPDVIGLWTPIGGTVDAAYIAHVRSEAVETVAEAWARRRPALLYVAHGTAPGLAKDTRLPDLIDDTVMAMGLRAQDTDDGGGIATLVNWNSHPSVSGGENSLISADFPHAVVSSMEKEWGGVAIYASGDLGGQIGSGRVKIPDPTTGKTPDDRLRKAELIGGRIAEIALAALKSAAPAAPADFVTLRVRARSLFVPMDNARFAEGLAIGLIRPRRLYSPQGDGPGRLPAELADPASLRQGQYTLRTEVAVIDVGPVRWALIPGELYPELALGGIQDPQDPGADFQGAAREPPLRLMSDRPMFLICLANDELGYIIPKSEWDSEPPYAYGRDEPQYGEKNSTGPETAPILMKAFQEILSAR